MTQGEIICILEKVLELPKLISDKSIDDSNIDISNIIKYAYAIKTILPLNIPDNKIIDLLFEKIKNILDELEHEYPKPPVHKQGKDGKFKIEYDNSIKLLCESLENELRNVFRFLDDDRIDYDKKIDDLKMPSSTDMRDALKGSLPDALKKSIAESPLRAITEALKGRPSSTSLNNQPDPSEDLIAKLESDLKYIQRVKMESDSVKEQLHFNLKDIEESKNGYDKKIFNTNKDLDKKSIELDTHFNTLKERTSALATELEKIREEKKKDLNTKISVFTQYIEDETTKLENKIAGINRIALAAEFINRREELEKSRKRYFWGFICGLGTIVLLGLLLLASLNNSQGIISILAKWILILKETSPDTQGIMPTIAQLILLSLNNTPPDQGMMPILTQVVSKLFLMGPVVWLTWFFAKQYANTNRLAEDYVFKATTALAYKGYEEKAGDDNEMKKELLRTAIRTFGDNPTRLLSKNECASPLNEAIQILDVVGKVQNNK